MKCWWTQTHRLINTIIGTHGELGNENENGNENGELIKATEPPCARLSQLLLNVYHTHCAQFSLSNFISL